MSDEKMTQITEDQAGDVNGGALLPKLFPCQGCKKVMLAKPGMLCPRCEGKTWRPQTNAPT